MAGDRRVVVARMADIDRRFRHAATYADRHQHRFDPIGAKAVRPADLVQHHVLGPQPRLDHLLAPSPADGQHAVEHEEVFDHLMEMTGSVLPDWLVH